MATVLNEIGFFQFDNLIRNRIPFVLLNLGVDLKGIYDMPLYQNHLESLSILVTAESAPQALESRQHPQHEAIVIICPSGQQSENLIDQLEALGYLNVFYVKGGRQSLGTDASR